MNTLRKQRGPAGSAFLFLFLAVLTVQGAETMTYDIRGRVLDPSGAVIAGARVDLFRQGQTPVATAETNEAGEFRLSPLAAGSYELVAQAPGVGGQRRGVSGPGGAYGP